MSPRDEREEQRGEQRDEWEHQQREEDPYATPSTDKYDSSPSSEFSQHFQEDTWSDDTSGGAFDEGRQQERRVEPFPLPPNESSQGHNMKDRTKEKQLELQLGTAGICGLVFVKNFVEGGLVGMAFGTAKAVVTGYQTGSIRAPGFRREVYMESMLNGRSLGMWLGSYRASKLLFVRTRGVEDRLNTFLAGFCAGSMYMLHTRSPVQIITSGMSSGVMLSILSSFGSNL